MWHHWYGDSGRSLCIVSYTPVWQQFIYFSLRTNLPTWTALWAVPAQSPPFLLPPSSWPRLPWRPGREGVLHRGPAHRLEGTERRQGGRRSGRSRGKTKRGIFLKKIQTQKKNIADANTANLEKPEHRICRHWCCFQVGGLEGGAGLQSRDPGTILRAMIKCRQCHVFLEGKHFLSLPWTVPPSWVRRWGAPPCACCVGTSPCGTHPPKASIGKWAQAGTGGTRSWIDALLKKIKET